MIGTLIAALSALYVQVSSASGGGTDVSNAGVFELDGNTVQDAPSPPPWDWNSLFAPVASAVGAVPTTTAIPGLLNSAFFADTNGSDLAFISGSSKDNLDTSGWQCTVKPVTPKDEIQNAYAAAFVAPQGSPVAGHVLLYAALERGSINGTSNAGFWLFKKSTSCAAGPSGTGTFNTGHSDGDILLFASFTSGGTTATINAYTWSTAAGGLVPQTAGVDCAVNTTNLCGAFNGGGGITTPWQPGTVGTNGFFEVGMDLTALIPQALNNNCFSTFLADTRSSNSVTADLHDYITGPLTLCTPLHVKKYIDLNADGRNDAGDVTTGVPVTNWFFTVAGPAPSTTVVCTGTTDATGDLKCPNLAPGTYTVTETQQNGFYNTEPGPIPTTANVTKTVTVSFGGDNTVSFGNTCFVAKTFQVNNVPSGTTGMFVSYTVTAGPGAGTDHIVALTINGTTASGTVANTLVQANSINWTWGTSNDHTKLVPGATNDSLAGGAYPACALTNTSHFLFSTVTGFKYKDVNHNGVFDVGTDLVGAGFTFSLFNGTTLVATTTSAGDGTFSFPNLAPGTYTVAETVPTGWVNTEPGGGATRTVVVPLATTNNSTISSGNWGNTPLSNFSVNFTPDATLPSNGLPATHATLTCTDANGNSVGGPQSGNTYSVSNQFIGTYNCKLVIVDP